VDTVEWRQPSAVLETEIARLVMEAAARARFTCCASIVIVKTEANGEVGSRQVPRKAGALSGLAKWARPGYYCYARECAAMARGLVSS